MKTKTKNKRFRRMTRAQKRVAIAKDVLKMIEGQTYTIQTGNWLFGLAPEFDSVLLTPKQTQELLLTKPNCTCCAIGAATASALRLFNKHALPGSWCHQDTTFKVLDNYFSEKQWLLIEGAFERRFRGWRKLSLLTVDERHATLEFGRGFDDPTERAKAIFTNIVKNKGTFKP